MPFGKDLAPGMLHAHDAHVGGQGIERASDPRHETAPAERHQNHRQVLHVLHQLQAEGALPGHNGGVVVGMDEVETGLLGARLRQDYAVVERLALEVNGGAVADSRVRFGDRRLGRHEHLARHTSSTGRERGCLCVVAGRSNDDAGTCSVPEGGELRNGASDLERAGALQVLGLKDDPRVGELAQDATVVDRCAHRHAFDDFVGGLDLVKPDFHGY